MLEASTTGPAQLRHKTINAEVNLLSEWQRQRNSLSEQITRAAMLLGLIALLTIGSMPFLFRAFFSSGRRLHFAQIQVRSHNDTLNSLEDQKKADAPRLDQGAMHETVVQESNQFLGQTILVMNSAEAGMAFQRIESDVISGELTINCTADAESNSVVQNFIDRAGNGQNVNSTLLRTAQKNGKLAPDGLGFEYVKAVAVVP